MRIPRYEEKEERQEYELKFVFDSGEMVTYHVLDHYLKDGCLIVEMVVKDRDTLIEKRVFRGIPTRNLVMWEADA